jgi:hypothetical protein
MEPAARFGAWRTSENRALACQFVRGEQTRPAEVRPVDARKDAA